MEKENPHITLGDYERLDNLDEVSLGFQLVNLVVFHIKNCVLNSLKDSKFSGKEFEDCNADITHFLQSCGTINPLSVSKFEKHLCLFAYTLGGRVKD